MAAKSRSCSPTDPTVMTVASTREDGNVLKGFETLRTSVDNTYVLLQAATVVDMNNNASVLQSTAVKGLVVIADTTTSLLQHCAMIWIEPRSRSPMAVLSRSCPFISFIGNVGKLVELVSLTTHPTSNLSKMVGNGWL